MKKKNNNNNVNLAKLGSTFYNIMEVNRDKILNSIISSSKDLNIESSTIEEISKLISAEIETSKGWGYDALVKALK